MPNARKSHTISSTSRTRTNPSASRRFVELADETIRNSTAPLIATGGTPMYFKALFEGLFEGPGADETIREQLRQPPAPISTNA